jgi:DNA-binding Xre family transcriptional regulator
MLKQILDQEIRRNRISNREAARQIGISHITIGRILKGDQVDLSTLNSVARWLKVNPSTLMDENAPEVDALASSLAVLLQSQPALAEMLSSAVERVEAGDLDVSTLSEVLSYMAYRLQHRH